jgi:hypothetical protein
VELSTWGGSTDGDQMGSRSTKKKVLAWTRTVESGAFVLLWMRSAADLVMGLAVDGTIIALLIGYSRSKGGGWGGRTPRVPGVFARSLTPTATPGERLRLAPS